MSGIFQQYLMLLHLYSCYVFDIYNASFGDSLKEQVFRQELCILGKHQEASIDEGSLPVTGCTLKGGMGRVLLLQFRAESKSSARKIVVLKSPSVGRRSCTCRKLGFDPHITVLLCDISSKDVNEDIKKCCRTVWCSC